MDLFNFIGLLLVFLAVGGLGKFLKDIADTLHKIENKMPARSEPPAE